MGYQALAYRFDPAVTQFTSWLTITKRLQFDGSTAGPNFVFSNSNLTVANPSTGWNTVNTNAAARASGKWYVEFTVDALGSNVDWLLWGLVPDDVDKASFPGNAGGSCLAIRATDAGAPDYAQGVFSITQANGPTSYTATVGSVVGLAIDFDNRKAWFHFNGSYGSGDPAAGTSPIATWTGTTPWYLCAAADGFAGTMRTTIRSRKSEFSYAIPNGFAAWDYEPGTVTIVQGAALLAGTGGFAAAATHTPAGAALLAGGGSVAATATLIEQAKALLPGAGVLAAAATLTMVDGAVLAGAGALNVQATHAPQGAALFAGLVTLGADAVVVKLTSAYLAGNSSLVAQATHTPQGAALLAGGGGLAASAVQVEQATALLAGSGALACSAAVLRAASALLAGQGALAAAATHTPQAAALLAGSGQLGAAAAIRLPAAALLAGDVSLGVVASIRTPAAALIAGTSSLAVSTILVPSFIPSEHALLAITGKLAANATRLSDRRFSKNVSGGTGADHVGGAREPVVKGSRAPRVVGGARSPIVKGSTS